MRAGAHKATYRAWAHMKERCDNPHDSRSHRYKDRGISYTPEWRYYGNFLLDMGEKPEGLTLERIDNDKGYSKDNCKWGTWEEQRKNKSPYCTSKIGVSGVHYCKTQKVWVARASLNGNRRQLYKGTSYSKACEARANWEAGK
jgi:hypothetical protein